MYLLHFSFCFLPFVKRSNLLYPRNLRRGRGAYENRSNPALYLLPFVTHVLHAYCELLNPISYYRTVSTNHMEVRSRFHLDHFRKSFFNDCHRWSQSRGNASNTTLRYRSDDTHVENMQFYTHASEGFEHRSYCV